MNLLAQLDWAIPVIREHSTPDRIQAGNDQLRWGDYTVTITQCTPEQIEAKVVKAGRDEPTTYEVTISKIGAYCGCPDCIHRNIACKHTVMVILAIADRTAIVQEA